MVAKEQILFHCEHCFSKNICCHCNTYINSFEGLYLHQVHFIVSVLLINPLLQMHFASNSCMTNSIIDFFISLIACISEKKNMWWDSFERDWMGEYMGDWKDDGVNLANKLMCKIWIKCCAFQGYLTTTSCCLSTAIVLNKRVTLIFINELKFR